MLKTPAKLGQNVKKLRNAYGESMQQLANVLNISKSAVSMYESGARQPDLTMLGKIASHYGHPLDELIRADFSDLDLKGSTLNTNKILEMIEVVLPVVCSETALRDINFVKGYEITNKIFADCKKGSIHIRSRQFEVAFEAYGESIEKSETIESVANLLSMIIFFWAVLPDKRTERMGNVLNTGNVSMAHLLKVNGMVVSENEENEQNKQFYIRDMAECMNECLKELKHSEKYAFLADYFVALRYIIGMIETDFGQELNKTIGMEMMLNSLMLGNPYAYEYVKKSLEI